MKKKKKKESIFEKCISCGKILPNITKDMDINLRNYYIEGTGQLCKKCYNKIYNKKNSEKLK